MTDDTDSTSPNPSGISAYKPEYAEQARKLATLGAIDREIGEFFGVTDCTIRNWRHRHAEFNDALQIGKDAADARVERSLYQRAVGYSFDAEKIMQDKGVVVRADYVEHLPPDVSAAQYWLNNRTLGSASGRERVCKHEVISVVA